MEVKSSNNELWTCNECGYTNMTAAKSCEICSVRSIKTPHNFSAMVSVDKKSFPDYMSGEVEFKKVENHKWTKCFIEIQDGNMWCYDKKKTGKPIWCLGLRSATISEEGRSRLFRIKLQKRMYILRAVDSQQKKQWIKACYHSKANPENEVIVKGDWCVSSIADDTKEITDYTIHLDQIGSRVTGTSSSGYKIEGNVSNDGKFSFTQTLSLDISSIVIDCECYISNKQKIKGKWHYRNADTSGTFEMYCNVKTMIQVSLKPGPIGISFRGNKVNNVVPGSLAENAGICVGWTILEINGKRQPNNHDKISQAIAKTNRTEKVTVISFEVIYKATKMGKSIVKKSKNDTPESDNKKKK